MSVYTFTADIYCHSLQLSKEIELVAHYNYIPSCKGSRGEHGEPLEPDDPEEINDIRIECNSTKPTELELLVCALYQDLDDYDQLEDEILNDRLNWR